MWRYLVAASALPLESAIFRSRGRLRAIRGGSRQTLYAPASSRAGLAIAAEAVAHVNAGGHGRDDGRRVLQGRPHSSAIEPVQ